MRIYSCCGLNTVQALPPRFKLKLAVAAECEGRGLVVRKLSIIAPPWAGSVCLSPGVLGHDRDTVRPPPHEKTNKNKQQTPNDSAALVV